RPDVVSGRAGNRLVTFLRGHGDGTVDASAQALPIDAGTHVAWLAAADVNADSHLDLVVAGIDERGAGHLVLLSGLGDGRFDTGVDAYPLAAPPTFAVAGPIGAGPGVGIAVATAAGVSIVSPGRGARAVRSAVEVTPGPAQLSLADLDGDGL